MAFSVCGFPRMLDAGGGRHFIFGMGELKQIPAGQSLGRLFFAEYHHSQQAGSK
jgi:hypothetical protein